MRANLRNTSTNIEHVSLFRELSVECDIREYKEHRRMTLVSFFKGALQPMRSAHQEPP